MTQQTLNLDPNQPQDALVILRSVIFSPNCLLSGDAFVACLRSLDTLAVAVGVALQATGTEGETSRNVI